MRLFVLQAQSQECTPRQWLCGRCCDGRDGCELWQRWARLDLRVRLFDAIHDVVEIAGSYYRAVRVLFRFRPCHEGSLAQ